MKDRLLDHLHPDLQPLCHRWLESCRAQAIDAFIDYGYRSHAEQAALYAMGRTAPGRIVTNARPGQSKHNFTLDGRPASKAFDFAIRQPDGSLNYDTRSPEWKAAVAIGLSLGLTWGGNFKSIHDYCHWEIE